MVQIFSLHDFNDNDKEIAITIEQANHFVWQSIIIAGRPHTVYNCSSIPLSMESKLFRKIINCRIARRKVSMYSFDDSMDILDLWNSGLVLPNVVLIFPKNFLDMSSNTIEEKGIMNTSIFNIKRYSSAVLCDPNVIFFVKVRDAGLRLFRYCIFFIRSIGWSKKHIKFSCLRYFRRYFMKAYSFSAFFTFFSTASKSQEIFQSDSWNVLSTSYIIFFFFFFFWLAAFIFALEMFYFCLLPLLSVLLVPLTRGILIKTELIRQANW